jgi:hypothetical protein
VGYKFNTSITTENTMKLGKVESFVRKNGLPRTISSSKEETTKAFLVALELSQTLKGRLARDVYNESIKSQFFN